MAHDWVSVAPGIDVLVRGWLSANTIVLFEVEGDQPATLIDSGHASHAALTVELLRGHPASQRFSQLLNTHCHSDHFGGNAALTSAFGLLVGVPVTAPPVTPWTGRYGNTQFFDQLCAAFAVHATIAPGDQQYLGGREWHFYAAPGHDNTALIMHCPALGTLITGDALWQHSSGFVWPDHGGNGQSAEHDHALGLTDGASGAFATFALIEQLAPQWIIPGHGQPFTDCAKALAQSRNKLTALVADPKKHALSVLRGLIAFTLMERGSVLPLNELYRLFAQTPAFLALNERYIKMELNTLFHYVIDGFIANGLFVKHGHEVRSLQRA